MKHQRKKWRQESHPRPSRTSPLELNDMTYKNKNKNQDVVGCTSENPATPKLEKGRDFFFFLRRRRTTKY